MGIVVSKDTLLRSKPVLENRKPRLYQVTLNWMVGPNTPQKHVKICGAYEHALKGIFAKSSVDALGIISECRENDLSIVSEFTWDVAESKFTEANDFVKKRLPHGFNPAMVFDMR